ncbi:MAG: hypothetical protein A2036_01280 [Omnitrophica bacterium GWA2_50_21]|nr:MAG: hypothetical protein A2036_01280 [Omnitrophica bacterium GWA2_50_21]
MFNSHKYLLLSILLIAAILIYPAAYVFSEDQESYKIGKEDVLDINVWQSPDLTKTAQVNSSGFISYPYLGDLKVEGLSTQEVEALLSGKLAEGYVKDPRISVSIKEYNSKKILVFGEVEQPGLYKVKGALPVLELLFLVKGVKTDGKRLTIIREGARAIEVNLIALLSEGDLSQNVLIRPGDTVYVASGTGQKYYVLGQVKKPGPYEWTKEITVLEAIKLADGGTETAALNRIIIRKHMGGSEEELRVNVVDIMKGKKKDDVVIKPGDVIVVPESWI